jgi:ribosome modulation factor
MSTEFTMTQQRVQRRRRAMRLARRLGANAQMDGRPTSANPYFDTNLMLRSAWLLGWLNAKLGTP